MQTTRHPKKIKSMFEKLKLKNEKMTIIIIPKMESYEYNKIGRSIPF